MPLTSIDFRGRREIADGGRFLLV